MEYRRGRITCSWSGLTPTFDR